VTGCATYKANYDIGLKEVERPAQAKERYGNQEIARFQEGVVNKYFFEDEMIKAVWVMPTAYAISCVLTNKTNHSIKILWDKAAFVDENRVSQRVIHSGITYSNHNNPQPPSVVVPNGTIQDLVFPADRIRYVGGGMSGGWVKYPFFRKSIMRDISTREISLFLQSLECIINENPSVRTEVIRQIYWGFLRVPLV